MSSFSSSSSSSSSPFFCPRCGDGLRFSSVPELRAHLVSRHTYETLLVLSQARARSSRPGALLPLPGPVVPLHGPAPGLDLASSSASLQLLRSVFGPGGLQGPPSASGALALPRCLDPVPGGPLGVPVGIGLEERLGLGLDRRIARTFAEVEERVSRRVGRLRAELQRREAELHEERRNGERLRDEKQEVEEAAAQLSRQVTAAAAMAARLEEALSGREEELGEHRREMVDVERFLRDTAEREAAAKARLQVFIETLLERADRAERRLQLIGSQHHHHLAYTRGGRSLDGSDNDIVANKMEESFGNRRSHSVSGGCRLARRPFTPRHHGHLKAPRSLLMLPVTCGVAPPVSGLSTRMRTMSLGSGGWDPPQDGPYWTRADPGGGGGGADWRREDLWAEEESWGRTWCRGSLRHHSTEEEEEEEEEWEEEWEEEEDSLWSSAERRRLIFARTHTPGSGSAHSGCRSDRQLQAASLRLRAGLFCVLPYLDTRSLLLAAEVCSDWRIVSRHPAVWSRLRLEDGRVSAQFLVTVSQWCTQTQSIILNNLKPRSRRANETQEEYLRDTRGSVEPGLEALLRSAGGSLLHLSVSQCPHVLTDRSLWLASCYSRNLHSLTYRSSSDPLGPEVLWALGAGCRSLSSLQVAPSQPCQQPRRFGNRCLQTIGRCWPRLLWLSVGGAGCGTQGLVAAVRSCSELQVLQLERVPDLGLQVASALCDVGLRRLHTLVLTHTPVSGQAILHFHGACEELRSLVVEVSAWDYFEEPDTPEARHLFEEILSTLKVLQTRPGLCDVLQVKVQGLS